MDPGAKKSTIVGSFHHARSASAVLGLSGCRPARLRRRKAAKQEAAVQGADPTTVNEGDVPRYLNDDRDAHRQPNAPGTWPPTCSGSC